MNKLDLSTIVQIDFPANQYVQEVTEKTQIVLHHSAGWDNARGMFEYWSTNKQRVATAIGITDDGTITQGYSTKYWGWHIGAGHSNLEKHSIGIEICNWGPLTFKQGKFYSWAGAEVPREKVQEYDQKFRGSLFYEKYTAQEIESVVKLLEFWHREYGIPIHYNASMWNVSTAALIGSPGVWTHVSFRDDKSDCHPYPPLIEALKSL